MFRRPIGARRGPSLLGAVATTAVVGSVASSSARHATQRTLAEQQQAQQMQQLQAQQAQLAAQQQAMAQQPSPVAPAAGMNADEKIARLEKLGALKQAGVLTPEEFAVEKAKILSA